MKRLLVYISSAFGGKDENVKLAYKYMRHASVCMGASVYASHVLYPAFCNDFVPEERKLGMQMGLDFLEVCDEYWAYFPGAEQVWSKGMIEEREYAIQHGKPIKMFFHGDSDSTSGPYFFVGSDWVGCK